MADAHALFATWTKELADLEAKIRAHPYVAAIEAGEIARQRLRIFVAEQFHIICGDLRGMGHLVSRWWGRESGPLCSGAVLGEQAALEALQSMASNLGMTHEDLLEYEPMAGAHAYGAYMAWLAHYGEDAQVAAAFAVNFPAWGDNCARLSAALKSQYQMTNEEVRFFDQFAQPAPELPDVAAAVVDAALLRGVSERVIKRAVRLLQEYELMFWDTVYEASK